MAKRKPPRPTAIQPSGQDQQVGLEVRAKGLLEQINQLCRPAGYVLAFYYNSQDDPDKVGPIEVKFERVGP
jgi:hypothetical protein